MLEAGAKAPSFTLTALSGEEQSLSDILKRGPALLALYKISCPTCQMTFPFLDRLAKGTLQVIGISQDDERGTVRFESALHLSLPMLLDREAEGYPVSNAFGVTHVPSLFMVEQDGTVSMASMGFSRHDLEEIGRRAGVEPFRPEEKVPEWKSG